MTPAPIRPGIRRLFQLAIRRPSEAAADVDDEIRFHLDARVAQLVARGMPADEARREAERRFGDVAAARTALASSATARDHTLASRERLGGLAQDFRFVLRSLRRTPTFVAVAALSLALGIGANVAIFSVVDATLLKPLPFDAPDRLVRVWADGSVPPGIMRILQRDSWQYSGLAGVEPGRQVSVTGATEPLRAVASQTTANLFGVLGVRASVGRTFTSGDGEPGAERTVLLGDAFWREHFSADSTLIGRTLRIDGQPRRVIGVLPPTFRFPDASIELWLPEQTVPGTAAHWWTTYLAVVGRLREGVTPGAAQAELATLLPRARGSFPQRMPDGWGKDARVVPLRDDVSHASRPTLLLLAATVMVVLLIACVNVATMFVARIATRTRELAVRTALGAGRARTVRLLLAESGVIATLGAVIGVALAWAAVRVLVSQLPAGTPRVSEIRVDGRALGVTLALLVVSVLIFGLWPALRANRGDITATLRAGAGGSAARSRASTMLAGAQIAFAVVLVTLAGLMSRSVWELQRTPLGFRTGGIVAGIVPTPSFASDTATRAPAFYSALIERAARVPGVRSAAAASSLPVGDGIQKAAMAVEAHPTADGDAPPVPNLTAVSDAYFGTLGIPLRRGRLLSASDRAGSARVAVVDEEAARTLWPTEDAIGQRLRYVWNQEWITVVGVVGTVVRDSLGSSPEPGVYIPMAQSFPREMRLIVAATNDDVAIAAPVRRALREVDATVPVPTFRPLASIVADSAGRARLTATLLLLFAGVALLLGGVGVYGVVSAGVARRTREIGVRMAVGASPVQVRRMIQGETLRIIVPGAFVGVILAMVAARALPALMTGVQATDPVVLLLVALVLAGTGALAAFMPARRASRVDPLIAIRAD